MDLSNKQDLERYFAENLDTYMFPVLAEHYLDDNELDRARKVCEIGLEYHPEDAAGWYILAKVQYELDDLIETEKCLKNVVNFSRSHIQARIELAELQAMLDRSPNTVLASWKKVLRLIPSHEKAMEEVERLSPPKGPEPIYVTPPVQEPQSDEPPTMEDGEPERDDASHKEVEIQDVLLDDEPEAEEIESEAPVTEEDPQESIGTENEMENISITAEDANINISPRMATLTLARVFKEQGLYYQALAVLDILAEKGGDNTKIEQERSDVRLRMQEAPKDIEKNHE